MQRLFSENTKILVITASLIVGLFVIGVVLKPMIIGYSTYEKIKNSDYTLDDYAKNVKQLEASLVASHANLSVCTGFNNNLLNEFDKNINKYTECKADLTTLQVNHSLMIKNNEENLKNINMQLEGKNMEIENLKQEKENEISQLQSQYDILAKNTANNLCCKAKIDNSKIRYFKVENSKVVCLEEGTSQISC